MNLVTLQRQFTLICPSYIQIGGLKFKQITLDPLLIFMVKVSFTAVKKFKGLNTTV